MTEEQLEAEKRVLHRFYMVQLRYNNWDACAEFTRRIKEVEEQLEKLRAA